MGLIINPSPTQVTICLLRLSQIDLPCRPCLWAMALLAQNEGCALFDLALPRGVYCRLFRARVNTMEKNYISDIKGSDTISPNHFFECDLWKRKVWS